MTFERLLAGYALGAVVILAIDLARLERNAHRFANLQSTSLGLDRPRAWAFLAARASVWVLWLAALAWTVIHNELVRLLDSTPPGPVGGPIPSEADLAACLRARDGGAAASEIKRVLTESNRAHLAVGHETAADASAMAKDIVGAVQLETVVDAKAFAARWIETAAQHARNEEYWRERAHRAERKL